MAEVALIYLPPAEGGRKQGVDDYLAAGNTVTDLLAHATSELREPPQDDEDNAPLVPYRATPNGLVWDKPTQNGVTPTPLTNFSARIVADVAEDDGIEAKRTFHVDARLGERERSFLVPAERFHSMVWATEHLGASAIVYPGLSAKDHARTAIQLLSGEIAERRTYLHTGWRRVENDYVYLHGGGAIGAEGSVEGIEVRLDGALAAYDLPDPPEDQALKGAIQASLGALEVAPDRTTFPLLAATFRAAVGETDFSVHIVGPTGGGKSELAALCTQHFGASLDARNLASWESTENALEAKSFVLKDSLVGVDDFAPSGSPYDVQRLHRKADRIIRGKGNASGRERMRADLTLRPPKPPRALILSTGEDVPRGQSLRARMLILEHGPNDLDWRALTACQKEAQKGLYARAMAGFISYLARDYEQIQQRLPAEKQKLREEMSEGGQHKRTPGIVADLALGLRHFIEYALQAGAIGEDEAGELWKRGWTAILGAAVHQEAHQASGEPAGRFIELIASAVASGRAHIAATSGEQPEENARALGWRKTGGEYADWRPQGDQIGWAYGDDLYLEPEASYRVAQREAQGGEALAVGARTLRKRLKEKGFLLSVDEKRQTLTVRRTVEGVKDRSVLHLRLGSLFSHREEPDEPDAEGEDPDKNGGSGLNATSGSAIDPQKPDGKTDETSGSEGARRVSEHGPDTEKPDIYRETADIRRVRQVTEADGGHGEDLGAGERSSLENMGVYKSVTTPDRLNELVSHLQGMATVAMDLETVGLNPATLRVRIISITTAEGTWLVDCHAVDPAPLLPALTSKTLIFHNALFDLPVLILMGLDLTRVNEVIDTMVMSRLADNENSKTEEAA